MASRAFGLWRNNPALAYRILRKPIGRRLLQTETASFNPRAQKRAQSWLSPSKIILGIIPIFTFGLGTWQVQRLRWKVAMVQDLEEKLQREAMVLPKQINMDALSEFEFRRVILHGTWDENHSVLIGPRTRDNVVGYQLVTPLKRPSGSTIIVDRGFLSAEHTQKQRSTAEEGEVKVVGMLRMHPSKNSFTPDNKPEKGEWYWTDVDQIAELAGGATEGVQPVLVEAIFDGHAGQALHSVKYGLPVGRPPTVEMRNEHQAYAITWYSLSAATAFMFWKLVRKGRG